MAPAYFRRLTSLLLAGALALTALAPTAATAQEGAPSVDEDGCLTAPVLPPGSFIVRGRPDAPLPWDPVPFELTPEREAPLLDAVAEALPNPTGRALALKRLGVMKQYRPVDYARIAVAVEARYADPNVQGQIGRLLGLMAEPPADDPYRQADTVFHELTHAAQVRGSTSQVVVPSGVGVVEGKSAHYFPMDGYWVGVLQPLFLMCTRAVFPLVQEPTQFDRIYLGYEAGTLSNDLYTILDEIQAYTDQGDQLMGLRDARAISRGEATRGPILRQLYHLDLYLGKLQRDRPEQWSQLVQIPGLGSVVRHFVDRAYEVSDRLKAYPDLSRDSDRTEAITRANQGAIGDFLATAGATDPVALDPRTEPLHEWGLYVFGF